MNEDAPPPIHVSPEVLAEVRALAERRLTPEEFAADVSAPMTAEEERSTCELIDWFCRRYPTPLEGLAYVRRAHARWKGTGAK